MGFPNGYADLFIPKLIVHVITLLNLTQTFISYILHFMGLEADFITFESPSTDDPTQLHDSLPHLPSFSAILLRELLPILKISDLVNPPEKCVVCLYEFDEDDEIRGLSNCKHVFHKSCIDKWMEHDRKTCPLCRMPFLCDDLQDSFNERLWAASGIVDYHYHDDDTSSFIVDA
uniref:brassinosteroid-responsive RING protein 1-like n=1 Tax=Erigeron canadensis TaxID=72917 RepID=UPI001CB9B395|nr:brassinosteroid-responsive RING protein 1-like [Erigeron canadensis]